MLPLLSEARECGGVGCGSGGDWREEGGSSGGSRFTEPLSYLQEIKLSSQPCYTVQKKDFALLHQLSLASLSMYYLIFAHKKPSVS